MVGGSSLVEGIYGTMADVGQKLQIALEMRNLGQQTMNIWYYDITASPQDIPVVNIAEAWWNHVKAAYRGLAVSTFTQQSFVAVHVKDADDPVGEAASWNIPAGEIYGTRTDPGGGANLMPPYVAVTAKLGVATRATRSGSKRFPFMTEADQSNGVVTTAFATLVTAVLTSAAGLILLGAPAALMELDPVVRGVGASDPPVVTYQPITSFAVNLNASTQNSRKVGRGA